MKNVVELREETLNIAWLREISLQQERAPSNGFDLRLSLTRCLLRSMIMKDDIVTTLREAQGKDLSQPVSCAGD